MSFHHEKLTVYQRALEFASWSQDLIDSLTKKTSTRDHLERSGDSVALNIAEGNGKFSKKDRARFFQIAHGSALESAACLDLLVAGRCCPRDAIGRGKAILEEIVKMLFTMLDHLGCRIAEDSTE
jgi:four helix bundle protein